MKIVYIIIIFLSLSIISCRTSKSDDKDKDKEIYISEDGTATIIGRIYIGSGLHPSDIYIGIEDENKKRYNIYPPELEDMLKIYQGRLIEFKVFVHNEPKGIAAMRSLAGINYLTVTPLSWEIIEGTPVIQPETTSLGTVQITGVVSIEGSRIRNCYIVNGCERWLIMSGETSNIYNLNGRKITVEGEGIVIENGGYQFDISTFPGGEKVIDDYIEELSKRRELRNVKILNTFDIDFF